MRQMKKNDLNIGIIGLGYVGLPLASKMSELYNTIGFDINSKRVLQLKKGLDINFELRKENLIQRNLSFTDNISNLKKCNIYIIAVPTPILKSKLPNLKMLKHACKLVGSLLNINDIVIFESTVYPGTTEEICIPILEKVSKIDCKSDLITNKKSFGCGYSPERVNPGDTKREISDIVKITSGNDKKTSKIVDKLYKSIIKAGTFNVKSIKIAEAAKIIENTQRDINIALINEFAMILNKININTNDVLNAAKTKWNFLDFHPGLVGGHCIGVDPYYLAYKAKVLGVKPKLVLSGRTVNDEMSKYCALRFKDGLLQKSIKVKNARIIIFGFTFKENCKDIRNTGVLKLVSELKNLGIKPEVFDPIADLDNKKIYNNVTFIKKLNLNYYDGAILAVKHHYFLKNFKINKIKSYLKSKNFIFDLKNFFSSKIVDDQL